MVQSILSTEMVALESALTVFASCKCSNKYCVSAKPSDSIKLHSSSSFFSLSRNSIFSPTLSSNNSTRNLYFELCSALQEAEIEEKPEEPQQQTNVKKLYVSNLPWTISEVDIKGLFGQCGTVTDVEIMKTKNGMSRGFAFVTMASGEEAQAAIDKFDSHQLSGRIIRVEIARRVKKPPPPPPPPPPRPPGPPAGETRHVIYASNLAWKARSSHLREFITENFKSPVSARVVFESPPGRSAGYGFVSFDSEEEAEAAISALDGKELMGRPLRLKFSQKNVEGVVTKKEEEQAHNNAEQEES